MTESNNITHEKVLSYEEAFFKIEKAIGIADTDLLVTNFIRAEEKNFALYSFVNEQTQELESLEAQISDITDEIDRIKATGVSRVTTGE
jgi:septal ring factor EnvC (AmiA/AmiB activator)